MQYISSWNLQLFKGQISKAYVTTGFNWNQLDNIVFQSLK